VWSNRSQWKLILQLLSEECKLSEWKSFSNHEIVRTGVIQMKRYVENFKMKTFALRGQPVNARLENKIWKLEGLIGHNEKQNM